jgi:hypothetical protein
VAEYLVHWLPEKVAENEFTRSKRGARPNIAERVHAEGAVASTTSSLPFYFANRIPGKDSQKSSISRCQLRLSGENILPAEPPICAVNILSASKRKNGTIAEQSGT